MKPITARVLFTCAVLLSALRVVAQSYSIDWHTTGEGGGASFGSGYALNATIGQWSASAILTGGGYTMEGDGFWGDRPSPARMDTLFVADYANHSIHQVTPEGVASLFASNGLSGPVGLAFDSAGNLYVGDYGSGSIKKLTPEGAVSIFDNSGVVTPDGLACDRAGNLYVANQRNNTIEKYTPDGVPSVFASSGLFNPVGLVFDRAGNLYAANHSNNTIQKFTPEGVGSIFASSGLFNPTGLAFDSAGNLYAANLNSSTIQKFTPSGDGSLFANTGLDAPWGLAFDSAGNLYASNQGSGTIEKFTPDGVASVFAKGVGAPYFIAFAPADPATVPFRISSVRISGDTLRFSFPAYAGQTFVVESIDDLGSDTWRLFEDLTSVNAGGTTEIIVPILSSQPRQFFRVRLSP
ncbi:MAG: hypothetical protein HY299_08955 [Verrucomicrobia bacterium]|nr:hypothetical protein [Verrucomicrobiota bacterium]